VSKKPGEFQRLSSLLYAEENPNNRQEFLCLVDLKEEDFQAGSNDFTESSSPKQEIIPLYYFSETGNIYTRRNSYWVGNTELNLDLIARSKQDYFPGRNLYRFLDGRLITTNVVPGELMFPFENQKNREEFHIDREPTNIPAYYFPESGNIYYRTNKYFVGNSDKNKHFGPKSQTSYPQKTIHSYGSTSFTRVSSSHKIFESKEFSDLYERIQEATRPIVIIGSAGTGKSSFVNYCRHRSNESLVILSPTGVSALNVGGETIHSFFRFPQRVLDPDTLVVQHHQKFKKLKTLIIDEISMVRADVLDAIDIVLRVNRKIQKAFGGVRVVMIGDIAQLPPILESQALRNYFKQRYNSEWFFDAKVLQSQYKIETLTINYRQSENVYIDILNKVRRGKQSKEDLLLLNEKCLNNSVEKKGILTITETRARASKINQHNMSLLSGRMYKYTASITGEYLKYETSVPTDIELKLKVGTQVMLLKNDSLGRWVNGTVGIITHLDIDIVRVSINESEYEVERASWPRLRYVYDDNLEKLMVEVIGEFTQFPITPAWAITIHKSQGLTLNRVIVDIGDHLFCAGQGYVALSRCTSWQGLVLTNPLSQSDIIVDHRVSAFFEKHGI